MATDKTVNELIVNKLTQAQFDAIPESERSDTELYFITDANEDDEAYLPLSGGTITGDLVIKNDSSNTVEPILTLSHGSSDIVIKKLRYGKELDFDNTTLSNLTGVVPAQSNGQLGTTGAFWSRAYVRNLNAGAPSGKDLLVPSKAGTLATLEDIPESTQLETLPVASADNLNKIYQYIGETTSNYINGHFYKSTNDIVQDWFTTGYAQSDTSLTLIITIDKEKFLAQNPVWQDMGEGTKTWRADYNESTGEWFVWTQDPNIYISNTDLKDIWGIDITNATEDYVPATGDTLMIQLSETEEFVWKSVDVQEKNTTNIPQHPTTPGVYTLMCYVDENGSASYAWESVA